MENNNLRKYLAELIKEQGEISSEEMAVFGKLVRLTLQFRDRLLKETNEILTVGETKEAINLYVNTLKEDRIPNNMSKKVDKLVRLWLKEINGIDY